MSIDSYFAASKAKQSSSIPIVTHVRGRIIQSPSPVLGRAAAGVDTGLVFLAFLVAGVLVSAGVGFALCSRDGSDVSAVSSLGLFSSLCFPSLPGHVLQLTAAKPGRSFRR